MTIPTLSAVIATIVTGATASKRRHEQARRNAHVIAYLEGMPAYLRNDIGLPPGAEIRGVVERGRGKDTADRAVLRNLGTMCHPV